MFYICSQHSKEKREPAGCDDLKSIDELTCRLDRHTIQDPLGLAKRIKDRLRTNIGPHITCSIGFAANRMLAKMACKMDKPDGATVWRPEDLPGPLLDLSFDDVSGLGKRMQARLAENGIHTMRHLLSIQPKQARMIWGNVNGERVWYALQGYAIHAQPSARGMYGHGRVLPPENRSFAASYDLARVLLTKAARRMRRERWYSKRLAVWIGTYQGGWTGERPLPSVNDDHACLSAMSMLWNRAKEEIGAGTQLARIGVTLMDLVPANERQLDPLERDDAERQRWETLTGAMDHLNRKFGQRVVTMGSWASPKDGNVGGKIAFSRIPSAEDFW